ncbi:hypothetical protein [Thioalkalivibrio sp. ALJT]|uniref:hypothetical protein n=1 Tax=Thioalkalivibrio sp. ALJT TaxID=1158146 RepID=UPI000370BA40|nr:hypothetical protein [Thioalkalivibrio sp. ALJT]
MTTFLHRFRSRRRELGLANALLLGLHGALKHVNDRLGLARYYLVAQPVGHLRAPAARQSDLQVRDITNDPDALERLPRTRAQVHYRLEQGGICLAAFAHGEEQMLGFIWLLFGPYNEDEHRCVLRPAGQPPSALDVDVYVFPEARGGLVFAELWRAADRALQARGIAWSLSRISAYNASSLRAHERLGARRIGSLYFLQLGGLEVMLTGRPPFIAFSRPEGPPPSVTLRPPRAPSQGDAD